MTNKISYEFNLNGTVFKLESGEIANHAQAAFMATYGETTVLITVSIGKANPELDFFPLTVDYIEKLYAGGLISSSPYIKREGRPTDSDILHGRLIDHTIRSLFPSTFRNEVQVISQVLSFDHEHDPVVASIIGVSFAILYSGVPFSGPFGASKVGYINNEFVINPTLSQEKESSLEMFVSSVTDGIVSVEAEAHDVADHLVKEGIKLAVQANTELINEQEKFLAKFGKKEFILDEAPDQSAFELLYNEIKEKISSQAQEAIYKVEKAEREKALSSIKDSLFKEYDEKIKSEEVLSTDISKAFEKVIKSIVRHHIIASEKRPDGRDIKTVRPITARVGVLPRVHGSALFSRGETQSLTIVTLGSERDAQHLQDITGENIKKYFHHYNMPGYANGEVDRRLGFANRRSIGHGSIGEKAVINTIDRSNFPYTIRVVSEITSSNGSTSMAATCASSLALMQAGVPLQKTIGGIGVGLVFESKESYKILTDIIGFEDFYGDMDFKITGSREGITAIQLDNKMAGIPEEILFEAMDRSKEARVHVINEMEKCLAAPSDSISQYAPQFKIIKISQDKIGELIGPGGKVIKNIIEKTNVEIDIQDDGTVTIFSPSEEAFNAAMSMINPIVTDLEIGKEYMSEVVRIEAYGVFVEIIGTKYQGLIHVSNLGLGFVKDLKSVIKVGQQILVKCMGKDEKSRLKFIAVNDNKDTNENQA